MRNYQGPSQKAVNSHRNLVNALKKWVTPELVRVKSFFNQGIVFIFKNGYKIVVIPHAAEHRDYFSTEGISVCYDSKFQTLKKLVAGKSVTGNREDGSWYFVSLMQAIKKVPKDTKAKQIERYESVYEFGLRDALATHYQLDLDPRKEFFLFGNDEARARFHNEGPDLVVPKAGLKVQLKDKSAILFHTSDGNRVLDIDTSTSYMKGGKCYTGKIVAYKPCKKDDPDMALVSMKKVKGKKTHRKQYLKRVLKKGVDLSKEEFIEYEEAQDREFTLKQDSDKNYYLEDENGRIGIGHPDLLIYVL